MTPIRRLSLAVTLLFLVAGFARAADAIPAEKKADKSYEVESIQDVAYYEGPDAHKTKHKLDLFVPKGCKDFPVLFFVHGGAWRHGDKSWLGVYSSFGKFCAERGIGTVVPNYRLSPGVAHPEHVKDVAKAFAWTHKNIGKYHGSSEQIFVIGHSAGGHLIALLATDEKYLKAEGLDLRTIKGAIPMSGVYRIPGESPLFEPMFGNDANIRKEASPLSHVRTGLPPFLIIYADNDLPYCGKTTSEAFGKALQECKCDARTLEVKERNHISLLFKAASKGDPVAQAFQDFIAAQLKPKTSE